ncbi:hypothetical protein CHUAL_011458 [Chamberlinius hualienensis]
MVDICTAANPTIYCTCDPSEYSIEYLDCVLLRNISSDDVIWDVFATNVDVETIRLSARPDGQFRYFPSKFVTAGSKVKRVTLQHGHVSRIPSQAFGNLAELTTVDVSSNQIRHMDYHAITGLPSLEELSMSDNELATLRTNTMHNLPKLKSLFMDRNHLKSWEPGAFSALTGLVELELGTNHLIHLKPDWFKGLHSLKRLYLNSNQLVKLESDVFIHCKSLEELNLRENKLKFIDRHAFRGLHRLLMLYLNRNQLVHLSSHTFRPLTSLVYFDMRQNKLETLLSEAVAPLNLTNNVTRIYLQGNNFVCDCRIKWMFEMFQLRKSDYMSEWKEVECEPPTPSSNSQQQDQGFVYSQQDTEVDFIHPGTYPDDDPVDSTERSTISIEKAESFMKDCNHLNDGPTTNEVKSSTEAEMAKEIPKNEVKSISPLEVNSISPLEMMAADKPISDRQEISAATTVQLTTLWLLMITSFMILAG